MALTSTVEGEEMKSERFTSAEHVALSYLVHRYNLDGLDFIAFDLGRTWVLVCERRGMTEGYRWQHVAKPHEIKRAAESWLSSLDSIEGKACKLDDDPSADCWSCFCPSCVELQVQWHEAEGEDPFGKLDDRDQHAITYGLECEL